MQQFSQLLPRQINPMQWIMLLAVITIASFMMLASTAEARMSTTMRPYMAPHPHAQTISHCGLLNTRHTIYGKYHRPYHDMRNTRIIQGNLKHLGYNLGHPGVDGKFGPITRSAVKDFQGDYALQRDGVVGVETSRVLAYASHPLKNVRSCNTAARSNWRR